jgi:hypothetical protein
MRVRTSSNGRIEVSERFISNLALGIAGPVVVEAIPTDARDGRRSEELQAAA